MALDKEYLDLEAVYKILQERIDDFEQFEKAVLDFVTRQEQGG